MSITTSIPKTATPATPLEWRIESIDGLRGLACLLVILFHSWLECRSPMPYWWNPAASGHTGVNLFLVLSGFCLYRPMLVRGREPSLFNFARSRFGRIFPPYYFALGLFAAAALLLPASLWPAKPPGGPSAVFETLPAHLLMIHNLLPEQIMRLNGPFWSLPLEIDLYVAMPLLVVAARRLGIQWAVAIAAVVTLGYRITVDHWMGGQDGWLATGVAEPFAICYSLPGRWVEFALGMLAAHLSMKAPATFARPWSLGLLSLLFLLAGSLSSSRWGTFNPYSDTVFGLGYFFLVLLALSPAPLAARLLSRGPLPGLGRISFSLYLIHVPLLSAMSQWAAPHFAQVRSLAAVIYLIILPFIVLLARIFYEYCELPFLHNQRRAPSRQENAPFATATLGV